MEPPSLFTSSLGSNCDIFVEGMWKAREFLRNEKEGQRPVAPYKSFNPLWTSSE
jgi:hypothetical protein